MVKRLVMISVLMFGSVLAMDEGADAVLVTDAYRDAYRQSYQLGLAAIQKCAAAGFTNPRAMAIAMLMRKEQKNEQSADFKLRMAALVDLLQKKPSKF